MPGPKDAPRRTQQERSALTRAHLLDAAYGCLLDGGYAATTVGAVQQRAGVARGTLLHHFPTRGSLMAGVIEDIVEQRMALLRAPTPGEGDDDDRTYRSWDHLVDAVWAELQGPAYSVALELWVAARTDAELREALLPLQERIFVTIRERVSALVGADHPRTGLLVQFTVDLLTGTHLAGILEPRAGTATIVEAWKQALHLLAKD